MDIEELVTKYAPIWDTGPERRRIRAALTELAAGYEQKLADMTRAVDTDYEQPYREANERIRQLEADADDERDDVWHDQWESHEFGASG